MNTSAYNPLNQSPADLLNLTSNTTSNITSNLASNETLSLTQTISAAALNAINQVSESATNVFAQGFAFINATTSSTTNFIFYSTKDTVKSAQDALSGFAETIAGNGTVIGNAGIVIGDAYVSASDAVADKALHIKYATATLGGSLAINSTMNLLQGRQNVQPAREVAKIIAGTGLAALSVYNSSADEMASVTNAALGAGLVTALVKVASFVKLPYHVHVFNMKSRQFSPELQNVVHIPAGR